jgi:hypothetical protein
MSYIMLTGRWGGIATLDPHAHSENWSDDSKDRFYEDLEEVSFPLLKYLMKFRY